VHVSTTQAAPPMRLLIVNPNLKTHPNPNLFWFRSSNPAAHWSYDPNPNPNPTLTL